MEKHVTLRNQALLDENERSRLCGEKYLHQLRSFPEPQKNTPEGYCSSVLHHRGSGVGKLQPVDQVWPITCFVRAHEECRLDI
ncbi:hypothetical protein CapIbe_023907 [Capra ibex]